MPFVIAAFALIHIAAVHENGSNNPLGISSVNDKIGFFPYFVLKDSLSFVAFIMFFSFFVYFYPNDLGHPDNYIPGNPMVTPEHIVPEWYFLPSYAILRSIPNKLLGVLALFAAILVLLVLPFVNTSEVRSSLYRPLHQKFFWLLVAVCSYWFVFFKLQGNVYALLPPFRPEYGVHDERPRRRPCAAT